MAAMPGTGSGAAREGGQQGVSGKGLVPPGAAFDTAQLTSVCGMTLSL
jgi:hypothetical protein